MVAKKTGVHNEGSRIVAHINKQDLIIEKVRARQNDTDYHRIPLDDVLRNKKTKLTIKPTNSASRRKIILHERIARSNEEVLVVVTNKNVEYWVYDRSVCNPIQNLVVVRSYVVGLSLLFGRLWIAYAASISNPYDIKISDTELVIDEENKKTVSVPQYVSRTSKLKRVLQGFRTVSFYLSDLLVTEQPVNTGIKFTLDTEYGTLEHNLRKRKSTGVNKMYYIPSVARYMGDYAVHIRRTLKGSVVLVRRKVEPIEQKVSFKLYENWAIAALLYICASVAKRVSSRRVNIYFEKFADKAEEGTIDLFEMAQVSERSRNYFIIRASSEDYERVKDIKGVVRNFSLRSYWLIYRANTIISTEAQMHVNLLRSNNSWLRRSIYEKQYVFLQHGITYMKSQTKNSSFGKGKEAEPDFILASSKKERDVLVDSLNISEERVLLTGLPIFSKIQYSHITQDNRDTATIMLTWKPYEEHLSDFSMSSYYQSTIEVYDTLAKHIDPVNVRIVAHPKVQHLLEETDLADRLWRGSISKVLEDTKLLITDYSSVCYSVFYQGGGVIFFQPDLERYELDNGELIPRDDEYIGNRVFDIQELNEILSRTVNMGVIHLDKARTKKFITNHTEINEYHDGKNIKRIHDELERLEII